MSRRPRSGLLEQAHAADLAAVTIFVKATTETAYRQAADANVSPPKVLTIMHKSYIIMHMRTTLNIDDDLVKRATKLTGISEKTSLVRMGLEALIAKESARRLAKLGASEPTLERIRRRRESKTA